MPKKLTPEEQMTRDPYKHQKKHYHKNKAKINRELVRKRYVKRYPNTTKEFWSDDRIQNFRKHKKILMQLKDIDVKLLQYYLKESDINV